jgi:hypothetical protein
MWRYVKKKVEYHRPGRQSDQYVELYQLEEFNKTMENRF